MSPASRAAAHVRLLLPFASHIKDRLGFRIVRPESHCEAVQSYLNFESALIAAPMHLNYWLITQHGYIPAVVTDAPMYLSLLSRKPMNGIEEIRHKTVHMPRLARNVIRDSVEAAKPGLWNTLTVKLFDNNSTTALASVLKNENAYSIINSTQWTAVAPSIKQKFHAVSIPTPFPRAVWLAAPNTSKDQINEYIAFAETLHEHEDIGPLMRLSGFIRFSAFEEADLVPIQNLKPTLEDCQT